MANANLTNELEGFFISLGFSVDDGEARRLSETVADTVNNMRRLVTYATGAGAAALGLFITQSANAADQLNDFSMSNNVGTEALQELGFAASNSGSSVDALHSSIASLNIVIGEAALGVGRGAMIFKKLQISAKDVSGEVRSVDDVLSEVSDRMQKMSLPEATAFARRIGIDPSMVALLRSGSDAIADLRAEARELGVTNAEGVQQGAEVMGGLRRVLFVIGAIKNEIAVGLFPITNQLLKDFREWIQANREIIRSNLATAIRVFSTALGHLWRWVSMTATALVDVVKWLAQFKIVLLAAVAAVTIFISIGTARVFGTLAIAVYSTVQALLAFNASLLLTPALIGAVILAIGLLIDDFIVWKDGGESLLEEVFGRFPDAVKKVKDFISPLQSVIDFFGKAYDAAVKFGSYINDMVLGPVERLWDKFKDLTGFEGFSFLPSSAPAPGGLNAPAGVLGNAASITNAMTTNSGTTISELNITVNSSDPRTAGESVVAELNKRNVIMTRNLQGRIKI